MDEKKILDQIRQSAEKIETPDSLEPENIIKKLASQTAEKETQQEKKETAKEKPAGERIRKWKWSAFAMRTAGLAAAAAVIFAAGKNVGVTYGIKTAQERSLAQENASAEQEAVQTDSIASMDLAAAAEQDTASAQTEIQDTAAAAATENMAEETQADSAASLDSESAAQQEPAEEMDAALSADSDAEEAAQESIAQKGNAAVTMEEAQTEDAQTETEEATAGTAKETESLGSTECTESSSLSGITAAESTKELYNRLKEYTEENEMLLYSAKGATAEIAYEDSADAGVSTGTASQQSVSGMDYSQTNLRDASVDEGDVVKTDGTYLYVMQEDGAVQIVSADGEKLTVAASVAPEDLSETLQELYVDGDRLYLVTSGSKSTLAQDTEDAQADESKDDDTADVYRMKTYEYVRLSTYDITDREKPKLLGSVEQEGTYQSSRKSGDYVYLFTSYYPQIGDTEEESDIAPLVGKETLRAERIYIPDDLQDTGYLVISSVSAEEPDTVQDCAAVVSGADEFYVSGESIYFYSQTWKDSGTVTDILKFSYRDGEIKGVGTCRIDGYLNDSFSIDEYNGYLRVVATKTDNGEEENTLLIFDAQMDLTGEITDIAQGETLRSARFIGDTGYFVTFRQTDPLFSADLSDPENPRILGELKISGFSAYLHVYGEDLLLGIGYEADEETGEISGIKLSMFDISDPSNVKEVHKYVIDGASYSPAFSDYRAVTVDTEKNVIGFVCDDAYAIFTYNAETGFSDQLLCNLSDSGEDSWWYSYDNVRGLYIGSTFYVADPDMIRAFDMEDHYAQTGKLVF